MAWCRSFRQGVARALDEPACLALNARQLRDALRAVADLESVSRRAVTVCRHGYAARLFVGGQNLFVSAKWLVEAMGRFDLSDDAARKVAADWLEEECEHTALAGLLRRATRFTCGPHGD